MTAAQQVRRPLIGIALSVVAGLAIQRFSGGSPLLWLSVSAFFLAAACRYIYRPSAAVQIYLICGLLAGAYSSIVGAPAAARSVLSCAEVSSREQQLIGIVSDDPAVSQEDGSVSFLFRVQKVLYDSHWTPADASLKVYLKNIDQSVQFGETWRLRGRVSLYEKPRSEADGFMSVPENSGIRMCAAKPSLMSLCYGARRRAAEILCSGTSAFPERNRLLRALLLGYRQAMPPDLYQLFSRTGVLHIFAISGLHVGVMAALLIAGLKLAGLQRPLWGWLLIPALFFYILSTGMKASALRAFTMAAIYFAAPLAGRRPDAPSSVALAAIALLLINPSNITDPGFQLSFVVVCGILMMHSWVSQKIDGLRFAGWDRPLRQLSGPHPAAGLLRSAGLLMITSLAAWLFSAPITARFFNTLSPVALVGNLAVIPLTFMIMLTGSLALLSGAVFLPAAQLFNLANVQFIRLLIWIVRRLSEIPGAGVPVRMPSGWVTGLWFAGLTLCLAGPGRWRKSALLIFLSSALLWRFEQIETSRDIRILRAGDAAMAIRLPEKSRWILATDGSRFGTSRAVKLLQNEGVSRIHTLVVKKSAGPEEVRRLQNRFSPQETFYGEATNWTEGEGVVRLSNDW